MNTNKRSDTKQSTRYCVLLFVSILIVLAGFRASAQDVDTRIDVESINSVTELWRAEKAHEYGITSIVFNPTEQGVLTGSFGNEGIKYWRTDQEPHGADYVFYSNNGDITSLSISSDGRNLLSTSVDSTVVLWTTRFEDREAPVINRTLRGHASYVFDVAFDEANMRALSVSADSTAILWDLNTGKEIHRFTGYIGEIWTAAIDSDGRLGATGSCGIYVEDKSRPSGLTCVEGAVYILNLETGERVLSLAEHKGTIYSVVFSSDGRYLLSGSADDTLILWDVSTGDIVQRFPSEACANDPKCMKHKNDVFSAVMTSDGGLLLSGSADCTVIAWDVSTGQPIRQIVFQGPVRALALNEANTQFAVGTYALELSLWGVTP